MYEWKTDKGRALTNRAIGRALARSKNQNKKTKKKKKNVYGPGIWPYFFEFGSMASKQKFLRYMVFRQFWACNGVKCEVKRLFYPWREK